MQVTELWRYPVKSMQGERRDELTLGAGCAEGDRRYGVFDVATATVISAKRDGRMLEASARYRDGELVVSVPGSRELTFGGALDDALSSWLGRSVRLVDALAEGPGTFECPTEFDDDESEVVRWTGIVGSFVDESELHLLSSGDLGRLISERPDLSWDVRRFRPNVVVDGGPDAFGPPAGQVRYRVGDAQIAYEKGCTRCVMTTRSQPVGIERQLDVLRHVVRVHANVVGVRARIVSGGRVRVGDSLHLEP